MSGEIFGFLMEQLFQAGALDVYYTAIMMKKNRPGIKVTVLCKAHYESTMTNILLHETTTLGVRKIKMERTILDRKNVLINTKYGSISIKLAGEGKSKKIMPEYEDCKKIAQQYKIPLRDIFQEAIHAYREQELEKM